MNIEKEIQELIERDMQPLAPHLQKWLNDHLIKPKKISLANDSDGKSYSEYWLITDHNGQKDSSYRIIFDDEEKLFGLV